MSKTLFIAEKPKVAVELLKSPRFYGCKKNVGTKPYYGWFENDKYIVSWAIGHLLEVKNPEDINHEFKQFNFEHLPMLLPIEYKVKKETKEQLEILIKLLNRPDVSKVVNAADIDREGELLFREIYEYSNVQKPVERLSLSSYEPAELEAALNSLQPGSQFDNLADSARSRQYLDYTLGINITRGSTTKLAANQFLLSSGRIQMCLLNEIRKRELEIENFKEQTYYNLLAITSNGIKATLKTDEQLLDPTPLNNLANRIKGTNLKVSFFKDGKSKKNPKNLYNLTDIYKDAHTQLNISAEIAKKHIQSLYENGFITYPRSNSRHLPSEMVKKVKSVFDTLGQTPFKDLVSNVQMENISAKHKSFNDELVTSHFAIIPTNKAYEPDNKPELEQKLYIMIVKRFIANFMSPAVYDVREVILKDQEEKEYHAKERVLVEKGYLAVIKDDVEEDSTESFTIPFLQESDEVVVNDTKLIESKTKRPPYHTEVSILTFMETAGRKLDDENLKELMKGKRIGTVATEETFIPKLKERGYIEIEKNKITTTEIGRKFVETFPVNEVKDPRYTAEMEAKIEDIVYGHLTLNQFIDESNKFASLVVDRLANFDSNISKEFVNTWNKQIEVCKCPKCSGTIVNKGNYYSCSNYPDCSLSAQSKILGKTISENQIKTLFEKKQTDLIKGFKKDDKEFDAFLIVDPEWKVKFKFPTAEDLSIAKCPKCGKEIVPKDKFYGCSSYKEGCTFSLPLSLKGKKIPVSQIKKLIENGRTDFINGFQGEKGEYTAAIVYKDENLSFVFPTKDDKTIGKCPECNADVIVGKSNYLCERYKNGCNFIIYGTFLGKSISTNNAIKLLEKNLTDLIKGFKSPTKGTEFSARLSYNKEQKKIVFVFDKTKKDS